MTFVRYPSIPYLDSDQDNGTRADKVMSAREREDLLAHVLTVEEKVDGENLGLSLVDGQVRAQARGSYVELGGRHFRGLESWLQPRIHRFREELREPVTLFGEWCADAHTVPYDQLTDWLLIFDVYDSAQGRFWPTALRDALAASLGLSVVPHIETGCFSVGQLRRMIGQSHLGSREMEGVVVRAEDDTSARRAAKLVRSNFTQAIDGHWSSGRRTPNRLALST